MVVTLIRNWLRLVVLLTSVVGAVFGVTALAAAEAPKLSVALSAPAAAFDATIGVHVDVTLTNHGATPVSVLTWNTPFEGIRNDIFRVTRDGQPVRYVGPMVKRAKPQPADYLTLAAGASKTVRINLAEAYAFDAAGAYQAQFDGTVLDVATTTPSVAAAARRLDTATTVPLSSAAVTLQVTTGRRSALSPSSEKPTVGPATPTFKSCSATRMTQLSTALVNAETIARNAYVALDATPVASRATARRSKLWFGAYTAARYALVRAHYYKIATATKTKSYAFDCTCQDTGAFAYVYPDQPYTVYLCGAFWTARATGTDSKAGTLVHESSHFTVLAGTQDYVYGQSGAKSLAIGNPAHAVMNADNHEYFAENTPNTPQP